MLWGNILKFIGGISPSVDRQTKAAALRRAFSTVYWMLVLFVFWSYFLNNRNFIEAASFFIGTGNTREVAASLPSLFVFLLIIAVGYQLATTLVEIFLLNRVSQTENANKDDVLLKEEAIASVLSPTLTVASKRKRKASNQISGNAIGERHDKFIDNKTKLFNAFRQRMLSESSRIARISLRNLALGILFSAAALLFLAYPLVADSILAGKPSGELWDWVWKYFLPRLTVGLILQFVGFFFLRLYVSGLHPVWLTPA